MAYCRFENTKEDLMDCFEHLLDDDLSEDEKDARKNLIMICREIVEDADNNEIE
jgi:hypothetical protein